MHFSHTLIGLVAAFATIVQGHAFMSSPNPRNSGSQLSTPKKINRIPGPAPANLGTVAKGCGNSVKGAPTAGVLPGGQLTVKWVIVANHGSSVKVSIAFDGDTNFQQLGQTSINSRQLNVKMPSGKTGNAIVQWLWDAPNDGSHYFACADITVGDANVIAPINAGNVGGNGNRNAGGNGNRNNNNGNRNGGNRRNGNGGNRRNGNGGNRRNGNGGNRRNGNGGNRRNGNGGKRRNGNGGNRNNGN
ncbi:hypothetical protein BATDEDRAFT_89253 [Batrachochytrium dendrobatidis JAM81]|uniref:Chitin-binding type-4 domain-containing protein n=2 Tax=Batrachochytrium dendrobatidis TaxID=109871 RepID=F4P507_BATDJ|nr:uncharacterized protein BATDEDRAFT_89253 [Batrachochytrium dendrobatidis JAM81]EGF80017.1 hypothetical protein BATDEDRAFT_89253 [Batrachochytrium dendrobatidis JAM81]OAJ39051.1 hypothetical protein BDEG_22928 [Batrachochytrium dendrobatidis JEL423]|eukprot:XP_006679757.1 hypothetical protein BATDEDRAFT_89253 [Batrachochytrium dendrobatidis JAM81]